jgi:small-conductance mechanosensitive channel
VVFIFGAIAFAENSTPVKSAPNLDAVGSPEILQLLNRTINWYRQLAIEQQVVTEADDITFADDNRRVAPQVVQLAFEFARQQAQVAAKQTKANQPQTPSPAASQYQGLAQMGDKADQQVQQSQANLDGLRKKLDTTAGSKRKTLESAVAEAQSELALLQARRDTIHGMVEFINGSSVNGLGASGLRAQIEELARSVPSALNPSGAQPDRDSASKASVAVNKQGPTGILALVSDLFTLSRKRRDLQSDINATNDLAQFAKQLRAPLVASLKQSIQAGDQLANQPDSTDPAVLTQQKQQLDALTVQFKQASATLLPLSKQSILLNLYQRNLSSWRDAVGAESRDELKTLAMHLGVLLVVLAIVFGVGEIVRNSIFRYVHDGRRRYQFLLLRRIFVWIAALAIIVVTFASELGSVATFAGLLTAGVVVALQNVILSVAGYFFLIGKYGIRVGDHVQLAGVNGEVVDVGLVRLHLLEMGGASGDSQPSGRVVAFSNSIVFQPTSGLFKQIPGASFFWHEISLSFAPENDYKAIKQRVSAAVEAGFKEYKEKMERQQRQLEASVNSISGIELHPRVRVHYTQSGIEAIVRYPADPQNASEMDDAIMRELLAAVDKEPKLKLLGSAGPRLRTDISGVGA